MKLGADAKSSECLELLVWNTVLRTQYSIAYLWCKKLCVLYSVYIISWRTNKFSARPCQQKNPFFPCSLLQPLACPWTVGKWAVLVNKGHQPNLIPEILFRVVCINGARFLAADGNQLSRQGNPVCSSYRPLGLLSESTHWQLVYCHLSGCPANSSTLCHYHFPCKAHHHKLLHFLGSSS